jgi:hypothetical protein
MYMWKARNHSPTFPVLCPLLIGCAPAFAPNLPSKTAALALNQPKLEQKVVNAAGNLRSLVLCTSCWWRLRVRPCSIRAACVQTTDFGRCTSLFLLPISSPEHMALSLELQDELSVWNCSGYADQHNLKLPHLPGTEAGIEGSNCCSVCLRRPERQFGRYTADAVLTQNLLKPVSVASEIRACPCWGSAPAIHHFESGPVKE